jgi:hypothetical protein
MIVNVLVKNLETLGCWSLVEFLKERLQSKRVWRLLRGLREERDGGCVCMRRQSGSFERLSSRQSRRKRKKR